jgi:hypothetical protein
MGNILVLTYWSYPDALIQTYTLPYVRIIRKVIPAGDRIFLLTLEKDSDPGTERNIGQLLNAEGIEWIPSQYHRFGWRALLFWVNKLSELIKMVRREKISVVHCWGTPAGAIGYILSKLTGCQLVLDSYEPHAEAMVENGTWTRQGVAFQLLFRLEKLQTKHATHIISATEGMFQYASEKYGSVIKKFYVKPACVDLQLFHLGNVKQPPIMNDLGLSDDHIVCIYAGKFGGIYLEGEVFDFLAVAARYWGEKFRVVLLTNSIRQEIDRYCNLSGMDSAMVITRFVAHSKIPAYIGVGDFALTPVKPIPSKRYCTPIKDGEYWALGLPVVIPANISDDSSIIEQYDIGAVLDGLNEAAYEKAVRKISTLIKNGAMRNRIRDVAKTYRNFDRAEAIYQKIYSPK